MNLLLTMKGKTWKDTVRKELRKDRNAECTRAEGLPRRMEKGRVEGTRSRG